MKFYYVLILSMYSTIMHAASLSVYNGAGVTITAAIYYTSAFGGSVAHTLSIPAGFTAPVSLDDTNTLVNFNSAISAHTPSSQLLDNKTDWYMTVDNTGNYATQRNIKGDYSSSYWLGFGVGLIWFGFGWKFRVVKRVVDF